MLVGPKEEKGGVGAKLSSSLLCTHSVQISFSMKCPPGMRAASPSSRLWS